MVDDVIPRNIRGDNWILCTNIVNKVYRWVFWLFMSNQEDYVREGVRAYRSFILVCYHWHIYAA